MLECMLVRITKWIHEKLIHREFLLFKITDNNFFLFSQRIQSILADRAGLTNRDLVEQIQKVYVDALEEYENKKRVKGGCGLAKYLLRLIDLRNISAEHSKMLTVLPIDEEAMPSVVRDIYMQSDKWALVMDVERGA